MTSRFTPHELIWTREHAARFWDFFSRRAALQQNYFASQVGDDVLDFVRRYVPLTGRVLDYGSGPGYFIEKLLQRGIRSMGLEISAESAQILNDKYAGRPFFECIILANELPSPIPAASCDIVFLLETIEHLMADDLPATIQEMHRVTAPGGAVVITTPHLENLDANKTICPDCGSIFHTVQHMSSWSVESLAGLMASHGFDTIVCRALNFRPRSRWNSLRQFAERVRKLKCNNLIYIGRKP